MARIGVLGCGEVANYGHIPAIIGTPGLELTAVCDLNPAKCADTAKRFGVPNWFQEPSDFFKSGLDAVVVASTATSHPANVFEAAKHGVHVLCEKPLALDDRDAEEMIRRMDEAGKMLLVGFVYRFSPVAQQIKNWLESGVIGDVKSLRLIYLWDLHGQFELSDMAVWTESPRWRGRMLEGGPMIDCGVHMIDLARWWTGKKIIQHSAHGAWVSQYPAPDHLFLHMDHEENVHSLVEMSFTYGHTAKVVEPVFTYELIGTGGYIRFDRQGWKLSAHTGQDVIFGQGASEKNFPGMYLALADTLAGGDPKSFPTGREGLIATQIAASATKEAIERKPKFSLASK